MVDVGEELVVYELVPCNIGEDFLVGGLLFETRGDLLILFLEGFEVVGKFVHEMHFFKVIPEVGVREKLCGVPEVPGEHAVNEVSETGVLDAVRESGGPENVFFSLRGVPAEGVDSGDGDVVEDAAEAEKVALRSEFLVLDLLLGPPAESAEVIREVVRLRGSLPGEPEITDLELAALAEQEVFRLEVSVQDLLAVEVV